MREGWSKLRLGDFVSLQRGHDLPEERRRTGSVPVMGSFGITGWHDEALAKGPGVVIGRSGASFGRVSYSERDYWPLNTCLYVTDFHGNHERFAFYLLSHVDFSAFNSGSAQPSLNRNYIYPLLINVPPVCEQRRIAEILGALDAKIDLNRRMNETLEAIAKLVFSQVLQRDEADWQDRSVGQIASRVAIGPFGSRITTDNFVESGVPVIRGSNLTRDFVDDGFVFLTPEKAAELKSAVARRGDLVFTHRGTLGQVGRIPDESAYDEYIVSQSQMVLSIDEALVSSRFMYYFFTSPLGQSELLANTSQTGVPAIARPTTNLKQIRLRVPPPDVSRRFDELVAPLEKKQTANKKESRTLAQLRDTLLPRLLSGELRVGAAEKALAGHV